MSRLRARKILRVFPAVVILKLLQRRLIEDATPWLRHPVAAVPTVGLIAATENEKDVQILGKINACRLTCKKADGSQKWGERRSTPGRVVERTDDGVATHTLLDHTDSLPGSNAASIRKLVERIFKSTR